MKAWFAAHFGAVALLTVAFLPSPTSPADILALFPLPIFSHTMPFMPILKELGRRGHQVTYISPLALEPNPTGFKQIKVNLTADEINAKIFEWLGHQPTTKEAFSLTIKLIEQLLFVVPICQIMTPYISAGTKPHLPVKGTHFDLIIIEPFFCTELLIGAGHVYNAPVVATLPMLPTPASAGPMGISDSVATTPHFRLPFSNNMNLLERTWNIIVNVVEHISNKLFLYPGQDNRMRDLFNETISDSGQMPYLGDLLGNISLLLTATHFSLSYPRPYLRNVVEVGGVNLEEPKPLPQELDKWMNESNEGVILFSWGSHYKAKDYEKIQVSLMKTFSQLKQRVLFKWEHTDIPNKPSNVRVQSWVPQTSILKHKNTVMFISHCGLSSTYEAVFHGVPVVATPLFGDQPHNAMILDHYGMAVQVRGDKIEEEPEILTAAIQKILGDPGFKKNALKRRELLLDRPMKPLEEAVYWVEYVMRHGGGQHLRPPALPWYSLVALDVIIFLAALASLPLWFLYFLCRRCRRSSPPPPSKPQLSKGKKNK